MHQLLALLSTVVGYDGAFGLLLLLTLITFPVAVWRFATIFVLPGAASAAAVAAVFLPGLSLAGYAYGQLPTAVGLVLCLFLVAEYVRFVELGGRSRLGLIAGLSASAFAAHHATPLLFLPPALIAALVAGPLGGDRASRQIQRRRILIAAATCVLAGAVVIAPFWAWAAGAVPQAPIRHNTRSNFLVDLQAQSLFVWGEYAVLPALALFGLWLGISRRTLTLAVLAGFFALVGLGGTTRVPALLFGSQWQWLTYDRFALWGAVALLPLAGVAIDRLVSARVVISRGLAIAALSMLVAYATANALLSATTSSPDRNVAPVATFLNAGRTQWRYQTFGLGIGAARLGYLTTAATLDGSYFSARRLPELTGSGIGNIDAALWWDPSGRVLRGVLARASSYSVRWGFVGESRYDRYLAQAGFIRRGSLTGGIEVWENMAAPALLATDLRAPGPDPAGILWGTLPLGFAMVALVFAAATYGRPVPRSVPFRDVARRPAAMSLPSPVASSVGKT